MTTEHVPGEHLWNETTVGDGSHYAAGCCCGWSLIGTDPRSVHRANLAHVLDPMWATS